ncbi:hypothetical protein ACS0TY_025655 [Phlomoides rotata]
MLQNRDLKKRRRVVEVENEKLNEEGGSLNLQLGRQVSLTELNDFDGKSGKKTKIGGVQSSRAVCQVEDCKVDLSTAKDYHRRHKVCDVHSKATSCLVGNIMQIFCQQCSRDHVNEYADAGLRTLILVYRKLREEEYASFNEKIYEAKNSVSVDRQELIDEVTEEIENDMILLGATAV